MSEPINGERLWKQLQALCERHGLGKPIHVPDFEERISKALTPSATARVPLMHTAYSATTGEELRALLGMFTPDIRLVTQDSEPAEAYYRIESDGEGVIVVKPMEMSQVGDPQTNGGCLE